MMSDLQFRCRGCAGAEKVVSGPLVSGPWVSGKGGLTPPQRCVGGCGGVRSVAGSTDYPSATIINDVVLLCRTRA